VEAADADRQSRGKKGPGQIDGAGKLVGLHADKTNQRPTTRKRISRMIRSCVYRKLDSA
jgi:hypothetical protein